MTAALETIETYLIRVSPGLILAALMFYLVRREARLRIVLYLALFVLLRDAMTPLGLWSFGTQGFFRIRLHADPIFLVVFGIASLGLSLGVYSLDRDTQSLVRWRRGPVALGLLWGIGGMVVVVAPLLAVYQHTAIESRGGPVPSQNLPAILVFALLGNLLEEALFRGYVYGYLAERMTPIKA